MKHPKILASVALVATFGVGIGIGAGTASHTNTQTVTTKTITTPGKTVNVPGPTKTVIKTVTVPAPPPAAGTTIATFHGTGSQATAKFNVPSDGNYEVAWTFSGNEDDSFGSSSPSNFIISNTGSGEGLGLANTIAVSGHGSTVVTDGSGTDQFNVQADGSWTLTVTAD